MRTPAFIGSRMDRWVWVDVCGGEAATQRQGVSLEWMMPLAHSTGKNRELVCLIFFTRGNRQKLGVGCFWLSPEPEERSSPALVVKTHDSKISSALFSGGISRVKDILIGDPSSCHGSSLLVLSFSLFLGYSSSLSPSIHAC